jgi:ubiquinone/menaquinone biosynthesis C-methylase UbiE
MARPIPGAGGVDPVSFAEHYKDCYRAGDSGQRLWRAEGASQKAANVIDIWSAAGFPRRPTVVDVGCGDGAIAARLSRASFFERLDGFDVSDSGVAIAKDLDLENATFTSYDGARLPGQDQVYDLAILSHVVEHVEEPRALIREAARVARWIVIEVPLERNARHRGNFEWTDTGHVNFYDPALIRQLVQSCGLTVLAERITNPGREWARTTGDRKGYFKWAVKQGLLRTVRPLATEVFTYHGVVLARQ